jgi:hypothetical protein
MSRNNPIQSKMNEKGNPNHINHVTIKKIIHGLPIPMRHATFVHHNDMLLLEVIHGKELT